MSEKGIEYRCEVRDFSKLDRRDGFIHFFLYQQDGKKQPMKVKDTYSNCMYVSWIQIHDRHPDADAAPTPHPKEGS